MNTKLRIVVADEAVAHFYDLDGRRQLRPGNGVLKAAVTLVDEAAHLHDRDFNSDRPGRSFDHAPLSGGRRGATAHHGMGGDRRPREHEARLFAHRIASLLLRDCGQTPARRLVLVAPPRFLGLLREALSPAVQQLVVEELHKDLVHEPPDALQVHLAAALCVQAP